MQNGRSQPVLRVYRVKCISAVLESVLRENFSVDLVFHVVLEERVSFHFCREVRALQT